MAAGVANLGAATVIFTGACATAALSFLIPSDFGWKIAGATFVTGLALLLISGEKGRNNHGKIWFRMRAAGLIAIPVGVGLLLGQSFRAILTFMYHKIAA